MGAPGKGAAQNQCSTNQGKNSWSRNRQGLYLIGTSQCEEAMLLWEPVLRKKFSGAGWIKCSGCGLGRGLYQKVASPP